MQKLFKWSVVALVGTVPGFVAGRLGSTLQSKYGWDFWAAGALSMSVMLVMIALGLYLIKWMYVDQKGTTPSC